MYPLKTTLLSIIEKTKKKNSWFKWHIHTFRCYSGIEDNVDDSEHVKSTNIPPMPEDNGGDDSGDEADCEDDCEGQRKEGETTTGTNEARDTTFTTSLTQSLLCFVAIILIGKTR